jgi:hypothetical protein
MPKAVLAFSVLVSCFPSGCRTAPPAPVVGRPMPTVSRSTGPSTSQRKVAGTYYHGDGLGVNCILTLSPAGACAFEWHGCIGVYNRNHGTFTSDSGIVQLILALPNSRHGFCGTATRFYPVAWAKRRYLVAEEQMLGFCSNVARRWRPDADRHGRYYLRRGDEKHSAVGLPDVPIRYRGYLRHAFATRVLRANRGHSVVIDRGSNHGVVPGTILCLKTDKWRWLRVDRVSAGTAECRHWYIDSKTPDLKIGTTLVTIPI